MLQHSNLRTYIFVADNKGNRKAALIIIFNLKMGVEKFCNMKQKMRTGIKKYEVWTSMNPLPLVLGKEQEKVRHWGPCCMVVSSSSICVSSCIKYFPPNTQSSLKWKYYYQLIQVGSVDTIRCDKIYILCGWLNYIETLYTEFCSWRTINCNRGYTESLKLVTYYWLPGRC